MARVATFSSVLQASSLALGLWAAALYFFRQTKAQHVPPLKDVLRADPRPPVLYLRAFNQESQFFIMGTKKQYGRWAKSFHAAISRDDQKIGLTVEEYLAQDLNESIGPFVALGSPEDYLAPSGHCDSMPRATSGKHDSTSSHVVRPASSLK